MSKMKKKNNTVVTRLMTSMGAKFGVYWILMMATFAVLAPFIANSMPYYVKFHDPKTSEVVGQFPLFEYLSTVDVGLLVLFITSIALYFMGSIHAKAKGIYFVVMLFVCFVLNSVFSLPDILSWMWFDGLRDLAETSKYLVCAGVGLIVVVLVISVCIKLHHRFTHNIEIEYCCDKHVCLLVWIGIVALFFALTPLIPPKTVNHAQYREGLVAGIYSDVINAPIHYSPKDYQADYLERMKRKNKGKAEVVAGGGEKAAANKAPFELEGSYMGTETNGGDLLSRMIYATRIALSIGFISTSIALSIGITVGGIMGYFAGKTDILGMRVVEIAEAIPSLVLMIIFVSFFGRNIYMMMVIIGFTSWSGYARFTRAEFLKLRKQDFIHAAKASGLPLQSILFKHMLPNGVAPVLVQASFGVAAAILIEAVLSFLGLGVVDDPSWGEMLKQSSDDFHWWMAVFPGSAIFMTVFCYNLIGEALRDAIDPNSNRKSQL